MNSSALDSSEYNPYYEPYISVVGEIDLLDCLQKDLNSFVDFINTIPNEKLDSIILEFTAIRNATISLFDSLNTEELKRLGIASDSPISVRALGFIICGHLKHHKGIIEEHYL